MPPRMWRTFTPDTVTHFGQDFGVTSVDSPSGGQSSQALISAAREVVDLSAALKHQKQGEGGV